MAYRILDHMSRPYSSVPIIWAYDGGSNLPDRFRARGLYGAIAGPAIARNAYTSIIPRDTRPVGLTRNSLIVLKRGLLVSILFHFPVASIVVSDKVNFTYNLTLGSTYA